MLHGIVLQLPLGYDLYMKANWRRLKTYSSYIILASALVSYPIESYAFVDVIKCSLELSGKKVKAGSFSESAISPKSAIAACRQQSSAESAYDCVSFLYGRPLKWENLSIEAASQACGFGQEPAKLWECIKATAEKEIRAVRVSALAAGILCSAGQKQGDAYTCLESIARKTDSRGTFVSIEEGAEACRFGFLNLKATGSVTGTSGTRTHH